MTSYLWQAKPKTDEEVVDEMLAIESEIEAWREKKSNEEASEKYYRMLRSRSLDEEEQTKDHLAALTAKREEWAEGDLLIILYHDYEKIQEKSGAMI